MTMDVTVVLYFFLFLFIFLYEITPPMPQILPIIAGVLSFADFILISFVFLIASSGVTFAALLALPVAEKINGRYTKYHSKNKCRQGGMKAQSKVKPAC